MLAKEDCQTFPMKTRNSTSSQAFFLLMIRNKISAYAFFRFGLVVLLAPGQPRPQDDNLVFVVGLAELRKEKNIGDTA